MTTLDPMLRSVIDAYFAAVNARDEAALLGLLAPDPVYFGSLGGVTLTGRDPMVGLLRAVGGRYADFRQTPGPTYGIGPEVAMIGVLSADGFDVPVCWTFRFDADGRLARVSTLFDPDPFLRHRIGAGPEGPGAEASAQAEAPARQVLDAYFETFNAGDEEAHLRLFHPEVAFHGSMTRLDTTGLATVRGVHRAAKETMKVRRLDPQMTYGRRTELAARVSFSPEGHEGQPLEGVWALRLDPAGLIDRISILWNPSSLARPARG